MYKHCSERKTAMTITHPLISRHLIFTINQQNHSHLHLLLWAFPFTTVFRSRLPPLEENAAPCPLDCACFVVSIAFWPRGGRSPPRSSYNLHTSSPSLRPTISSFDSCHRALSPIIPHLCYYPPATRITSLITQWFQLLTHCHCLQPYASQFLAALTYTQMIFQHPTRSFAGTPLF